MTEITLAAAGGFAIGFIGGVAFILLALYGKDK